MSILGSETTRYDSKPIFNGLRVVLYVLRADRCNQLGENVIFPASGYIAMAIEAIFQKTKATGRLAEAVEVSQVSYKLRDVTFSRALPLEDEDKATKMVLTLNTCPSTKESWHEFIISSVDGEDILDHCQGRISIADEPKQGMFWHSLHRETLKHS